MYGKGPDKGETTCGQALMQGNIYREGAFTQERPLWDWDNDDFEEMGGESGL